MPADNYTVIITSHPSGSWVALCPTVPGAAAQADSKEAVLRELAAVMAAFLAEGVEPIVETADLVSNEIAQVLRDRALDGLPLCLETIQMALRAPVAA